MALVRPVCEQPEYGRRLGDAGYWRPYVVEVLDRHGLPVRPLETPFVGSFPTFLVGDLVVKLFGPGFDGGRSNAVERAMHALLAAHPSIPAPGAVADGRLFDGEPAWPYLVTQRVRGTAIREVELSPAGRERLATALGQIVRDLHGLAPPPAVAERVLVPQLRADAPGRLRRFGLPEHLVDQVPAFLAGAEPADVLVHGDITADHVFVDGSGELVAVIDWGDALVADRAYELPAVFLDALGGDARALGAFLDAARWPRDGFPRRALHGILEFQFDAIAALARRVDLTAVPTLDELAERLFAGHAGAT